jgi:antitoxin HicB
MMAYRIELTPDDNGTFLVTCPAIPEVTTFADDEAEAFVHACHAIEEAIAARIAGGRDIPSPDGDKDGVSLPMLSELKALLYSAARNDRVTRAELARRLGWNRESVDRLFRLDHASRLSQMEAAFKALGLAVRIKLGAAHGRELSAPVI